MHPSAFPLAALNHPETRDKYQMEIVFIRTAVIFCGRRKMSHVGYANVASNMTF